MITDFLPHRAPMLLIDRVDGVTAAGGTGHVRLSADAWYADAEGRTPAWIGLELMAQAVAACRGRYLAGQGSAPGGGYLVGTRSYRSTVPTFPPGVDLAIQVRLVEADDSGLSSFDCEILQDELPLATATLKVMEK